MDITQGQLFNFISGSHVSGDSSYEIWKALGNNGEQQDFLNSLKGDKGDKGEDGKDGEQGPQGVPGSRITKILLEGNINSIQKGITWRLYDSIKNYDDIVLYGKAAIGTTEGDYANFILRVSDIISTRTVDGYFTWFTSTKCSAFKFPTDKSIYFIDVQGNWVIKRITGIKYST